MYVLYRDESGNTVRDAEFDSRETDDSERNPPSPVKQIDPSDSQKPERLNLVSRQIDLPQPQQKILNSGDVECSPYLVCSQVEQQDSAVEGLSSRELTTNLKSLSSLNETSIDNDCLNKITQEYQSGTTLQLTTQSTDNLTLLSEVPHAKIQAEPILKAEDLKAIALAYGGSNCESFSNADQSSSSGKIQQDVDTQNLELRCPPLEWFCGALAPAGMCVNGNQFAPVILERHIKEIESSLLDTPMTCSSDATEYRRPGADRLERALKSLIPKGHVSTPEFREWMMGLPQSATKLANLATEENPRGKVCADGGQKINTKEKLERQLEVFPIEGNELQLLEMPALPSNLQSVGDTLPISQGRHNLDFYESPFWFTTELCKHIKMSGTVLEPCVGGSAIASVLEHHPSIKKVVTNDIDLNKVADHHFDAAVSESWDNFPVTDWVITNPPFGNKAAPIVINAFNHAKVGVAMFLLNSFLEPCADRAEFLEQHPPNHVLIFPRFCFRKNKSDRWGTDNTTINCYIWLKDSSNQSIKILSADSIEGFYKTPDKAISLEAAIALLPKKTDKKTDKIKCGNVKTGYLYQRKKGNKLIWEYRFADQNHYVAVGKLKRVREAILQAKHGYQIVEDLFQPNVKRSHNSDSA